MMMTDEDFKRLTEKFVKLLPDNPHWALTAMVICTAKIARAINAEDERVLEMLRTALKNTKKGSSIIRPDAFTG